jgi:hypothetical protein
MSLQVGDCVELMASLEPASVDAIVTDPPYGLGFMGKDWDSPGGVGDFPMRRTKRQTPSTRGRPVKADVRGHARTSRSARHGTPDPFRHGRKPGQPRPSES